ncbi:acetylhydrolase [Lysobacter helvus]|uniref:Acetylhydrolase n=2 Tax=Lysobacteraceae TaxID=32033 RepID=A0ABM7Q1Z0_9GAMM|nr:MULTISPECIES: alpha/beta hydrolase [Lysobacter]BCT91247.1 acetylhydrolase [Lysobacter caseinilyticus]BCT94400.1 acetylhydrolase [Lysobacter helvus]
MSVRPHPLSLVIAALLATTACHRSDEAATTAPTAAPAPATTVGAVPTQAQADPQMQAVLDQLAKLGGKPVETLTAVEARKQPSPADAVKALLESQGKPTTPEAVAKVENRTFPGPGGAVPIRIYTPEGKGPMPVVLYIHGGGWVIADLDTYDASPRAIANAAKAIVVSTHYRQGPEHLFPAAHDDTLAAYEWLLKNAAKLGGDPKRIALVGESAGGNMAADIAIAARDKGLQAPLHQVLVYPVADKAMDSPSYLENANAKPLNKPMMEWFAKNYLGDPAKAADPRISLVDQPNLAGLPPATIILAQIDPLRSGGEKLAEKLQAAGVPVTVQRYDGVAHEFFGMGAVVDKAKQAQQLAGAELRKAFEAGAPASAATSMPAPATTVAPAKSN